MTAEFTPATAVDAAAVLDLLDAALPQLELQDVLSAVAGWWQRQTGASTVAAAVVDEHTLRTTAAWTSREGPPRTAVIDRCRLESPSLQHQLAARHSSSNATEWIPFERDGLEWGMLAIEEAAGTISSLPVEVTRRILSQARERADEMLRLRLESLAEFCAGAGHEINNPLGSIVGRTQLLVRDETDPERLRKLGAIGGQALRVRDMIGDAMLFARPPEPQLERVRLSEAIDRVASRFRDSFQAAGVQLRGDRDNAVEVSADVAQLEVVMSELLRNSLEGMPDGGELRIDVASRRIADRQMAELTVADAGSGLTDTDRLHLFDPFYSGRNAGRGLGFGLSKCWRIVTQHGGCLHAVEPEHGLTMLVHWPLALRSPCPA